MRIREPELWKGVVAGAAAGLAAAWVMTQFQAGWSKIQQKARKSSESGQGQEHEQQQGEEEDATMKVAGAISRKVFGRELSTEQKQRLGPLVHYGFGALMGAAYGGTCEQFPSAKLGWGTGFGSALFLCADEIAVPLLGLSESPAQTPLSTHLYAWASHLVYGAAAESVRRPLRSTMGYEDLGSKVKRAQDAVEDFYGRAQDTAEELYGQARQSSREAKKQAREKWKIGSKRISKAVKRMRKAA